MKSLFIIILCFLLTSCSEKQYRIFTLPEETPVSGIDYPNELFMNYPWSIDIIDDKLLLFATKGDYFMRIVDANNGKEIKQIGLFGGGPKEFVQPVYWGKNGKEVYVYDEAKMYLRTYSWHEILNAEELPEAKTINLKGNEKNILFGKVLNQDYFVGSVVVGMPQPIIVLDKELNTIGNMGNIPDKDHQSEALVTYGGSVSSYGNKFASTMASFGYIACYEQQADGTCKILWDACAEQPIYKKDQLDLTLLKLGFADVKMTKNYIFCSYFGQKYNRDNRKNIKPRNMLVFDHQGNLLKNLRSERSLARFTISEDEKTIYAATEEPEVAIIRFDISNILK
ncbi:TolB-like 6-bladed beta-propeller domain-containing protein [Parabacteroides johnsonii]|nr:TolB-like 6-bladed beta-propeller domain-containing protein [Parabacteroides johnsonii]